MSKKTPKGFEISVSARNDGTIEATYIRITDRRVHRTEEIKDDVLFADYDAIGNLVGIELLAPAKMVTITNLVDKKMRPSLKRMLKNAAPPQFIAA